MEHFWNIASLLSVTQCLLLCILPYQLYMQLYNWTVLHLKHLHMEKKLWSSQDSNLGFLVRCYNHWATGALTLKQRTHAYIDIVSFSCWIFFYTWHSEYCRCTTMKILAFPTNLQFIPYGENRSCLQMTLASVLSHSLSLQIALQTPAKHTSTFP